MGAFVASYSGGKDSILAIDRSISAGHRPLGLITTYNTDAGRSWFHGLSASAIDAVSQSLKIPIKLIKTNGENYAANFEAALTQAKQNGASMCIFGDIDIETHLQWCQKCCENAGIEAFFPLLYSLNQKADTPLATNRPSHFASGVSELSLASMKQNRKNLVHELIDKGYTARITIVNTNKIAEKFLGKILTHSLVEEIDKSGADACGENGEYHTLVTDGPIFSQPVGVTFGDVIKQGEYIILPIL